MTIKVMDCDLVVLGAGGAGLVAAVKAADVSGKKVIVLEKAKKVGGATIFAHGFGPETGEVKDSKWHKEAGYTVNDPPDISGQWFDWLVSKGGAEEAFTIAKASEKKRGQAISMPYRQEKYKDHPDPSIGPGWWGSYVVDKMVECCGKMGIPILTQTRARSFIVDDNGNITGVLADTNDGQLLVNCKACVIAAGGYGANYEKLRKYYPELFDNKIIHCLCPPAITGDCLDMAEEIGGVIDQTKRDVEFPLGFFVDAPMHHPYSYSIHQMIGNDKMVAINLDGKRWKNEGGGVTGGVSLSAQPKAVAYSVCDDAILETIGAKLADNVTDIADKEILKKYREDIEYEASIDDNGADGNHTKKADTLAELALKMKVDPAVFVATMERYNKFCETGKDLDFGKRAESLKAIIKPPFYAFFGQRWSQCTKGRNGICVNSNFEVLRKDGKPIQGLWAGGDGCVIFGGLTLNKPFSMPAMGAASAAGTSGAKATTSSAAPNAGGVPGGAPSAAPGPGGTAGGETPSAMMAMMGSSSKNVLEGEGAPCGGLGSAFLSGYYIGINAGDYLKNI